MESVNTHWLTSARALYQGYRHFISAIILNWLVVGIAAGEVPRAPLVAQTGLLLTGAFFYTAAASRATGFTATSPFALAVSRAGVSIEPIAVSLCLALLAAALVGGGALVADSHGAIAGAALAALFTLIVVSRVWPVFSLPFLFAGETRWSPAARGAMWRGPGLAALKSTRKTPGRRRASACFVGSALVLATAVLLLRAVIGSGPWIDIFVFAGVMPYLALLNFSLTRSLLEDARALARPDRRAS